MTSYSDIISTFHSIIKSKYVLADELVDRWFLNALGEYELNIESLGYDKETMVFTPISGSDAFDSSGCLKGHIILNLAELMKSYYMQQEVRRVNQLNNIIGKDLSLNGTGDTKKYTREEADRVNSKVEDFFTKQKTPAYI